MNTDKYLGGHVATLHQHIAFLVKRANLKNSGLVCLLDLFPISTLGPLARTSPSIAASGIEMQSRDHSI